MRFLCIALYFLRSSEKGDAESVVLTTEICEAMGVALYSEIQGTQDYGFPLRKMVQKRKRDLSTASKHCFQAAIDIVDGSQEKDDSSETRATWDLLFMIGKVRLD